MKKTLAFILTLCLLLTMIPAMAISANADKPTWATDGTGTESDPWMIKNTTGLEGLAAAVNAGDTMKDKCIKLTDDFVCDKPLTTPIGDHNELPSGFNASFQGTFDGNGQTVELAIGTEEALYATENAGLFGYVAQGGTVKNVTTSGAIYYGSNNVGGVVGCVEGGTVTDCAATGTVSGKCGDNVGGVVGNNFGGAVTNCYATGTVSGSSIAGTCIGGVVGKNNSGIVTNCYATGAVSGVAKVGGVVGRNNSGTVTNCYATGTVSGISKNTHVGGVVGYNFGGTVTNCYATGKVSGTNYVGGVVGQNDKDGVSTNCYCTEENQSFDATSATATMTEAQMKAKQGESGALVAKLNAYATSEEGKKAGCKEWTVMPAFNNGYPIFAPEKGECAYFVELGEAENQPLFLNENETKVTVSKAGDHYVLKDAEGKVVSVNSNSTWQYDGGLYYTTNETKHVILPFLWKLSFATNKTTKYYLNVQVDGTLTVSTTKQTAEIEYTDTHEWEYVADETGAHTAICKKCGTEKATTLTDHEYDDETNKCVCGKLNPSTCKITAVKVEDVKTVYTSPLWLFKRLFFISRSTYAYQITTEGNQVKAVKVETSANGEDGWKLGTRLTSDLKLSELYIRVTDSEGAVTNWKYENGQVTKLNSTYSFTVDGNTYQAEYGEIEGETFGTWASFVGSKYNTNGDFTIEKNDNNKYGLILYKGKYLKDYLGELVHAYDYSGKVATYLTPCIFEVKKAKNDFTSVEETNYFALQGVEMNAKWEKTGNYTGLMLIPISNLQQTWKDVSGDYSFEIKDDKVHIGEDEGYDQDKKVVARNNLLYQTEARDGAPVDATACIIADAASNGKVYFYATSPVVTIYVVKAGYAFIKCYKPYFNGENWLFMYGNGCGPIIKGVAGIGPSTSLTNGIFPKGVIRCDILGCEYANYLRYYQNGKNSEGTITYRKHDLHSDNEGVYLMEASGYVNSLDNPDPDFDTFECDGTGILWFAYNTPNGEYAPYEEFYNEYQEWFNTHSPIL